MLEEELLGNTIIMAWCHPGMVRDRDLTEQECHEADQLNRVESMLPVLTHPSIQHIIHVGEPIDFATCLTESFMQVMKKQGFKYSRIPISTICQVDYFYMDAAHQEAEKIPKHSALPNHMCRTEVQVFSRTTAFDKETVAEMFGSDLAQYRIKLENEGNQYAAYLLHTGMYKQ